ncbi:MAG: nucleotidyl transferase AbiEii/AbiGii toxin family protein [Anaerolineae bacterium]
MASYCNSETTVVPHGAAYAIGTSCGAVRAAQPTASTPHGKPAGSAAQVQAHRQSLSRRTALALAHLPAEKLRALRVRGQPRDLYDIWLLLREVVEPDLTLVDRKLALYNRDWKREAIEEALEGIRPEWKQDLRPLLPQFVPYEVARERVDALLE